MRAVLDVMHGQSVGESYPVTKRLLIGRDIDCDVQLFDEGLSRTHFLIEQSGEGAFELKDLGSSNGTYLNNKRILVSPLTEGDIIRAGSTQLVFRIRSLDADADAAAAAATAAGSAASEGWKSTPPTTDFVLIDEPEGGSETKIKRRVQMDTLRWISHGQKRQAASVEEEQASRALSTLYKVGNAINAETDLRLLYLKILDLILEVVNADRAFLILWYPEENRMEPVVGRNRVQRAGPGKAGVSKTVVEDCVRTGESILSSDAMSDNRFKAGQSIMLQNIRSVLCVPLESSQRILGAIYLDTLAASDLFLEFDLELVTAVGRQAGIAIERARLVDNLQVLFYDTIRTLVATIEAKDKYTRGHTERVTSYAVQLARELGLSAEEIDLIHLAGLLHDIGKIGISEEILNKPGKLTDAEYEIIKTHTVIGADIVKNIKGTEQVVDIVRHHHERLDGRGYPDGLEGTEISLPTRILTVADSFDAMTSNRAYRRNFEKEEIIAELRRCAGKQFDPHAVEVFVTLLDEDRLKPIDTVFDLQLDSQFSHYFEQMRKSTGKHKAVNPPKP